MARSSISFFRINPIRIACQSTPAIAIILLSLNLCGQVSTASKQHNTASALTPDDIFSKGSHSVFIVEAVNLHGDVLMQQNGVAISQHIIASTKNILESISRPGSGHSGEDWIARYRIRQGHRTWNVTNVFIDMQRDLSTFESLDLDATPAQVGSSISLSVGEKIYAINYPKGQEQTLTEGKVSALRTSENAKIISTSVSLSDESAGSGLFDPHGKLVGIVVFDPAESLNKALPAEWLRHPNVLFSGKPKSSESRVDHGKLWDSAAILKENIQTFARDKLITKNYASDPTGEKAMRLIYHSDDDNAAEVRIDDSLFLPEDSPEKFDNWPVWRQATAYMESIRSLMSTTSKARLDDDGLVSLFSRDGRKLWSDISDVYCHELPGAPYTDLEGKTRLCPLAQ